MSYSEPIGVEGCVAQLVLLIAWGFLGSWLTGHAINLWVENHTWYELHWGLRWVIGVFAGKFAAGFLLVGFLIGATITSMPIL